ncbi:hypothetical protein M413DRAFT_449835 [Hebeloma cylindrosporum]|uniref:Uncharacterized protein n=1 Tax=Hebeloma cylindrosporum TaxID=76867 RepID=A0A0C3BV59_HEBCY|nr:hypothetical protein M413DRAFT_449835 [Hebeloma cylindrosporum h7]
MDVKDSKSTIISAFRDFIHIYLCGSSTKKDKAREVSHRFPNQNLDKRIVAYKMDDITMPCISSLMDDK